MSEDIITPLRVVIDLGEQALAEPPKEIDRFLLRSDRYLKALESWRAEFSAVIESGLEKHLQREEVLTLIALLQKNHTDIVGRSKELRDGVQQELSSMRKRATGLKAYIDRFPKRITITGRRQG